MWFYLKLPRSPNRVSSFRKWVYPVFLILPVCLRKGFRVSMEYPVSRIEYIVFQMEYPAYRMKKTRAPLSGNLVLHFGNRVLHLVIGYPIPETRYPFHQQNGSLTKTGYPTRETGFSFILSHSGNQVPNTKHWVPIAGYPFQETGYDQFFQFLALLGRSSKILKHCETYNMS